MSDSSPPHQHATWKLWLNPILRRYCRSRLRLRVIGTVLLADLLVAGFIVAMAISTSSGMSLDLADTARTAVIPLLFFQGIILFVLGTAQVSGGMIAERDEGVIDYQRLIPMTPLAKSLGYLFGLPIREYVMFAGTLPFSLWAIWVGGIPLQVWGPLYLVVISSAILYHLTGLVTGTVVRNRRAAFLFSTGWVFALYTIIPWASNFGLVFFKYLTIRPVLTESAAGLAPNEIGQAIELAQLFAPSVKFFNLGFSETVFTLFTQAGLMLTFLVMLCRKWRSDERHLLGKVWAACLFAWIHILLLGNALPLIKTGKLFPSQNLTRMMDVSAGWAPGVEEAVAMSGLYGLVTLMLMFMLCSTITPSVDAQKKAWRQAHKHGLKRQRITTDAASSWFYVLAMALVGGLSWFIFCQGLFESHWFKEQLGWGLAIYFIGTLLAGGLIYQTLLEGRGKRVVTLFSVLIGVVPLMVGAVFSTIGGAFSQIAAWTFAVSPLCMPIYGAPVLLSLDGLLKDSEKSAHHAFYVWLIIHLLLALLLSLRLRKHHRSLAQKAAESAGQVNPPPEANAPQ